MNAGLKFLIKNKALSYPQFRKFLLLRFTLIMALNMQTTIVGFWMYDLTHRATSLGKLGLAEAIPAILCSLISGHFVDQREKRGLLVKCIGAYVVLAAFFTFISQPHSVHSLGQVTTEYLIYTGIFLGGIVRAFVSPSSFSLLGMLLPKKRYVNATTWSSTAWQIGAVIGPLLGGLMIGYASVTWGFGLAGVLILIAFMAAFLIPRQPVIKKERESMLVGLKQGLRFVFSTQIVLAALSLDMFAVLFGGATALLPVYVKDVLHVNELWYGWLRAAPGIGSVMTLAILSFIPLKKKPGLKLLAAIAGFGITIIVFGISTIPMLSFAMLLVGGMFDAVSVVIRGTILQLYTPADMRGRVSAVNTMFVSSSNELGEVESGYTAHWFGAVPAVVGGGVMTILIVAGTFFMAPRLRKMTFEVGKDEKEAVAAS